jgi:hypothetical protein
MTPVSRPYVGTANPIRTVPGGGLSWIITAGNGALKSDGHLLAHVRGLVLADQAPVPPTLQGTNPIPDTYRLEHSVRVPITGPVHPRRPVSVHHGPARPVRTSA